MEISKLMEQRVAKLVPQSTAQSAPLPLKWVYDYKYNKQGYVERFKARLCVRGDRQPVTGRETYAATLAARTFRTLVAVYAKFGLAIRQYDMEGAFTYSWLDEDI